MEVSLSELLRTLGVIAVVSCTQFVSDARGQGAKCGDERDDIIQEYVDEGVDLKPQCGDFTQTSHSAYFTYKELTVNEPHSWALIGGPLAVDKGSGYGLDKW